MAKIMEPGILISRRAEETIKQLMVEDQENINSYIEFEISQRIKNRIDYTNYSFTAFWLFALAIVILVVGRGCQGIWSSEYEAAAERKYKDEIAEVSSKFIFLEKELLEAQTANSKCLIEKIKQEELEP